MIHFLPGSEVFLLTHWLKMRAKCESSLGSWNADTLVWSLPAQHETEAVAHLTKYLHILRCMFLKKILNSLTDFISTVEFDAWCMKTNEDSPHETTLKLETPDKEITAFLLCDRSTFQDKSISLQWKILLRVLLEIQYSKKTHVTCSKKNSVSYLFSLIVFIVDIRQDKINSAHSISEEYRVFTLLLFVNLKRDKRDKHVITHLHKGAVLASL